MGADGETSRFQTLAQGTISVHAVGRLLELCGSQGGGGDISAEDNNAVVPCSGNAVVVPAIGSVDPNGPNGRFGKLRRE